MAKFFKMALGMLLIILCVVFLRVGNFYGYDHFTADEQNDGSKPRAALQHFGNPNVPWTLDSNPVNMGSRAAMEVIATAFSAHNNVPTSSINATIAGTRDFTLADVTGSPTPLYQNGLNEVLNVDTREMANALGIEEGNLGAGLITIWNVNSGEIAEATLHMTTAFGEQGDFESTAVHELAHCLGLMHTPITPISTIFDETLVPTMYPFALSDDRLGRSLEPDDIASLSELYPELGFQTAFGVIAGTVNDELNLPVFGAVIFAMNVTTGDLLCRFSGHTSSVNGNGAYVIRGVPPGNYVVGAEVLVRNRLSDYGPENFDGFYVKADQTFFDRFYSATPSQPQATEIAVAAGQTATANLVVPKTAILSRDDAFEDNDTPAAARPIAYGSYNLTLTANDEDWFKVTARAGQSLRVLARFAHAIGDVDMGLYDPNGNIVDISQSELDDEILSIDNVTLAGDYFLRLVGATETTANSFTLTVFSGAGSTGVAARETDAGLPREFGLSQNYPNPFWSEAASRLAGNPETMIRYELPKASHISLVVYDLAGRQIAQLEAGLKTAGVHFVRWDGRDQLDHRVPSGIYFYRLEAAEANGRSTMLTKKLTVMK